MGDLSGSGWADHLRAFPLFEASSDAELSLLGDLVDDIDVEADEVLEHVDEGPLRSYVVLAGEALVTAPGQPPRKVSTGQAFGDLAGDEQLRRATITAHTPMRLLVLDRERLRAFVDLGGIARRALREDQPDRP